MIKLIVDSTCDLPDEFIEMYDVKVLPLYITLEGEEYRDKKDIQVDQVYSAMRKGIVPRTSQINFQDCYNVFEEYCSKGYNFIYIAFSSALSGTYQFARHILSEFEGKYQNVKMEVLDSKSGSVATGLMALQAAKMIRVGYQFEEILEQIKAMISHVEHLFTITDLKWLVKGGRLDKLHGMIGSLMNVKPLLDLDNGSIEVIRRVRGRENALHALVDILAERIKDFPDQVIGISHADDLTYAEELKASIVQKLGSNKFILCKIGGVLGSHLGIGGIGVFFFNQKPACYLE